MHHIYHTQGIVLSSKNTGEANKFLTILTRGMGLICATVQGIRYGKSKLRFALQNFSYAQIDFVRGREIWRVTSATARENFSSLVLNRETKKIAVNIISLTERLYHGEEANPEFFDAILDSLTLLKENSHPTAHYKNLEIVIVLRLLYHLGYLAHTSENDIFVKSPLSPELFEEVGKVRGQMLSLINQSLRETML